MREHRRTVSVLATWAATAGTGLALAALATAGAAQAAEQCQGQATTIVATADGQQVQGTAGADVISTAGFERVTVQGNGGDDVICAAAGRAAQLIGGDGADTLVDRDLGTGQDGEQHATVLVGGAGDDHVVGVRGTVLSYASAGAGVAIDLAAGTVVDGGDTDTVLGVGTVHGSRFPDTYVGTSGPDTYRSGPAANSAGDGDEIRTGGGDDDVVAFGGSVRLGSGADRALGYGASIDGGTGADEIRLVMGGTAHGGYGADVLSGFADLEQEEIEVPQGTFRLTGGPGDDVLSPVYAAEQGRYDCPRLCARGTLAGGTGTDTLVLERRRSVVDLAAGVARVLGGRSTIASFENVEGSPFRDVLRGDPRANHLDGNAGDDVLRGRGGRDLLHGGAGRDRADGGPDRDGCRAELRRSC